jgi:threonine synthase
LAAEPHLFGIARGATDPPFILRADAFNSAMFLSHLECSACGMHHDWRRLQNLCTACAKPLFAIVDLAAVRKLDRFNRSSLPAREKSLWRYRELLPLPEDAQPVSLGEGGTPLPHSQKIGSEMDVDLWIKDESLNPTQSFKARGMSVAVSMAKYLGAQKLAVPSAGNAGGALAAYAARAGLEAQIFMPRDTPRTNIVECRELGAHVTLIDGLITDCAAEIARRKEPWFEMSTLKEPYRIEGKKTLGYEIAEQLDWRLPDVVLYPTGGGTGLVGMWKAFDEMEALGWIGNQRPRMFSVQASGCAPIVRAFESGEKFAAEFPNVQTIASGLRVPRAIGDFLILKILRASKGGAVAIDDDEIIRTVREVGSKEGLFIAPESAACFAGLKKLRAAGKIDIGERVVIFNTGSGIKYLECFD